MVSKPGLLPWSWNPTLPVELVICEDVVGWALAPWTLKRTRAPLKSWPNWSSTSATRSFVPPTTAAPCFGVSRTVAATRGCQVTVTAFEVRPPTVAVMVEVPVTSEPKVKTALPADVWAVPCRAPGPVTVKATGVSSPTGFPDASLTAALTESVPPTGARAFGFCWLSEMAAGGPAHLAAAVAVTAGPPGRDTAAVMVEVPVTAEPNWNSALPEASVAAEPEEGFSLPVPEAEKATFAPGTAPPCWSITVAVTRAVPPIVL